MALPRLAASRLRRVRRSTLPAVVLSLVIALVVVACRDMVTDAALQPAAAARSLDIGTAWTVTGTGASYAPDTGGVALTYHDPGYTYGYNESWSWQRIADDDGTLDLAWTYNGFHRWFQAHAWLDIWSEDASGNVTHHQVVNRGTYDVFTFSGTIQLPVTAGHPWGVTATGYNYDITPGLDGSIILKPRVSQGSVQGVVTDAETGAALPGAQVSLQGTSSGTTSDGQGAFTLADVPAGGYTLSVSAPGHLTFSAPVTVTDGETTTQDVALTPLYAFSVLVENPSPVSGVLVTATNARSGEVVYQTTGEGGTAHFNLLGGHYIFSARRVATTDPGQLQVWPFAGGEVPVSGDLGAFAGAVYVSGDGSQILTPGNYHRAFRSPLDLNATSFAELGGQITLSLTPTATIGCTLLDADGNPIQGSGAQVFGTLPYADTSDLPPIPESFTGNRDLPRGLGYGVANVGDDGSCALPGAPEGTTVLETPPIQTPDGPVVYRTSVDVTQSDADNGSTVEAVAGPQPQLSFTNYFTGEPWGDERGGSDIGGLITFGWKDATTSTFVVTSGFRGLGTYSLELFTSDPGAGVGPKDAAVRVSVICSAKRCKMLPSAPKPPKGTTATGVSVFSHGDSQGTLVWQVPLPGNPDTIWLRITTSGKSDRGDQTVVLPAVRQPGNGNSYVIMAGS